jgi:DNA-binding CsgD family transcriptional regulator
MLTAAETCAILTTHRKTLYERIYDGSLKAIKERGMWKIYPHSVADYLIDRELTGRPPISHHRRRSVPRQKAAVPEAGGKQKEQPKSILDGRRFVITLESITLENRRVTMIGVVRQQPLDTRAPQRRPHVDSTPEHGSEKLAPLTRAERQVFEKLQLGMRDKEISKAMNISDSTVRFHVRNIFRKRGYKRRIEILSENTPKTPNPDSSQ